MFKAIKVLNLFSTLLFAGILLLVYAFLPISVDLHIDGFGALHKQQFFYYAIAIFVVINLVLRLIFHFGTRGLSEQVNEWFTLLIFIVNVYLTLLIGFVGVINNETHISASSYAYLNYLGPIAIFGWVIGLFFNLFASRKTSS